MSFSFLNIEEGKLALVINPPFGTSLYSSKAFNRENPRAEITESEIENAISQAIWKLFDEERSFFSKRLNISEMDIVMADVRVLNIKLDGGIVINPIGFSAKNIEIGLSMVLITRDILEKIKLSMPKKEEIAITIDPSSSYAQILRKNILKTKKDFAVINLLEKKTFIYYSFSEEKISYISDFDWGTDNLNSFLSQYFNIHNLAAKNLIYRYIKQDMSEDFFKKIKHIISEPFIEFSKGIALAARNINNHKLSFYVLNNDLSGLNSKNIFWRETGIKINFQFMDYKDIAVQELLLSDTQNTWNKIAKRRMKWLMCHK